MPAFPASHVPDRSRRGAGPAGPDGGPDKPGLFQGFIWARGKAATSIAAAAARKRTRRNRMPETSVSARGRIIRIIRPIPEDIMRQTSVVATVALFLFMAVYPRAQAPTLNRDVAPLLPVKQIAYIRASNAEALDHFACGGGNQGHTGTSISISGDGNTLAVGAPFESGGSRGINGNQNDNSMYAAGAVYVYTRQGQSWAQQAYVKASNPGLNDHFGSSVALSRDGNTMAGAAHWEARR